MGYIVTKLVAALIVGAGMAGNALAQMVYPERPIHLVVGFATGGSADLAARAVADALGEKLGRPVVVENRLGAGSVVAAVAVAKAEPDGYTLLFGSTALSVQMAIDPALAIDPLNDLAPVALVSEAPNVLVVPMDPPIRTVQELIAYAKSGKRVSFGSSGVGTSLHLSGELLKDVAKIDIVHVPFKGSGPALNELVTGRIQMMFDSLATSMPLIKAGKIRPLAVTSRTRTKQLPDVPTMAEAGYDNFETSVWFGILAPKKTPKPIVDKVAAATTAVLADRKIADRLEFLSMDLLRSESPERFAEFFRRDAQRWKNLVKAAGVKVDKN